MSFTTMRMSVTFIILSIVFIISWGFLTDLSFKELLMSHKKTLPSWLTEVPIAHRGLHKGTDVPENTLAAFQYAKEQGFAIELDTHLSKDGEVIVFHDEGLGRLTNKTALIRDLTLNEIQELRILGTDQIIPTLDQVLSLVNGEVPIYVEVKNWTGKVGDLEAQVHKKIKEYKGPVTVISFNPESVRWFKNNAPEILRGQTACGYINEKDKKIPFFTRFTMKNFLLNWRSKPHFLVYELGHVENNQPLKLLKKFKTVITYGAEKAEHLDKAAAYSENYMFDNIGDLILSSMDEGSKTS